MSPRFVSTQSNTLELKECTPPVARFAAGLDFAAAAWVAVARSP